MCLREASFFLPAAIDDTRSFYLSLVLLSAKTEEEEKHKKRREEPKKKQRSALINLSTTQEKS